MTISERIEFREEEAQNIEKSKAGLAEFYALDRNKKFDLAYEIAWEHGHSCGINEVEIFFGELVPLLEA